MTHQSFRAIISSTLAPTKQDPIQGCNCQQYEIVRKKQTVDHAASSNDALVDSDCISSMFCSTFLRYLFQALDLDFSGVAK